MGYTPATKIHIFIYREATAALSSRSDPTIQANGENVIYVQFFFQYLLIAEKSRVKSSLFRRDNLLERKEGRSFPREREKSKRMTSSTIASDWTIELYYWKESNIGIKTRRCTFIINYLVGHTRSTHWRWKEILFIADPDWYITKFNISIKWKHASTIIEPRSSIDNCVKRAGSAQCIGHKFARNSVNRRRCRVFSSRERFLSDTQSPRGCCPDCYP